MSLLSGVSPVSDHGFNQVSPLNLGEISVSDQTVSEAPPAAGWRLKLGVSIFVFSILVPVAGMPIGAMIDLSTSMSATVIG